MLKMEEKLSNICGECRFLIPEYDRQGRGKCYFTDNRYLPSCGACKAFVERYGGNQPTNGDVIRQGGNDALAEFKSKLSCEVCAYANTDCYAPAGRPSDCKSGVLAWLNAPAEIKAESEGEDE